MNVMWWRPTLSMVGHFHHHHPSSLGRKSMDGWMPSGRGPILSTAISPKSSSSSSSSLCLWGNRMDDRWMDGWVLYGRCLSCQLAFHLNHQHHQHHLSLGKKTTDERWMDGWMDECYVVGAYSPFPQHQSSSWACHWRRAPNPNKLQTEESAKREDEIWEMQTRASEREREIQIEGGHADRDAKRWRWLGRWRWRFECLQWTWRLTWLPCRWSIYQAAVVWASASHRRSSTPWQGKRIGRSRNGHREWAGMDDPRKLGFLSPSVHATVSSEWLAPLCPSPARTHPVQNKTKPNQTARKHIHSLLLLLLLLFQPQSSLNPKPHSYSRQRERNKKAGPREVVGCRRLFKSLFVCVTFMAK